MGLLRGHAARDRQPVHPGRAGRPGRGRGGGGEARPLHPGARPHRGPGRGLPGDGQERPSGGPAALAWCRIEERRLSAWRNAPNVVTITSPEWNAWLRMRRRGVGVNSDLPRIQEDKKGRSAQRNRTWAAEGQGSGLGLRIDEIRTVHRSKDGVEVMAAEPKSEAKLIRALSEDLALEIRACRKVFAFTPR